MNLADMGMIVLFTVYGGTWIVMGVLLWLGSERTAKLGIASDLRLLSLYAIVHGASDVIDVLLRLPGVQATPTSPLAAVRLALLTASFIILLQFGLAITIEDERVYKAIIALGALAIIGLGSGLVALYAGGATQTSVSAVEATTRHVVGLPGALLAAVGFFRLSRKCNRLNMAGCAHDSMGAAVSLAAYGILAGAVTSGYPIPTVILGLPVQFYRMLAAIGLAVSCLSLLRRFEVKQTHEQKT